MSNKLAEQITAILDDQDLSDVIPALTGILGQALALQSSVEPQLLPMLNAATQAVLHTTVKEFSKCLRENPYGFMAEYDRSTGGDGQLFQGQSE